MLVTDLWLDFAIGTQGQAVRQIFLDGDQAILLVGCQIDDRKPAERKLVLDAVFAELKTGRQGVVGLLHHRNQSYD